MAETLDFRHPEQQSLERSLHAPPPEMERFVEDLNAAQISHHHAEQRPKHSRLRQHDGNTSRKASSAPKSSEVSFDSVPVANPVPVTVVRSGKVYRQLFDAGVQLSKAYDEARSQREQQGGPQVTAKFGGSPLVHISRDLIKEGTGILGTRQQQWLNGFPNENSIENPVLYKLQQDMRQEAEEQTEEEKHQKEVRDLPDVVVPRKDGSDIMTKIAKSREQRHTSTVDELHQELLSVAAGLEAKFVQAGENLLSKLSDNDLLLASIAMGFEDRERLMSHTQSELKHIWRTVQEKSSERRLWIKNMSYALNEIEDQRATQVASILSKYSDRLKAIAHAAKPDLDKVIDGESQLINQMILSNRRSYAELYRRLTAADIERERRAHDSFTLANTKWQQSKVADALKSFTEFMHQPDIIDPPTVTETIGKMVVDQIKVHKKRMELLESLNEFIPPNTTKKSVYMWNDKMAELSHVLSDVNERYLEQIYSDYERVCEHCAQKATDIRTELIRSEAATASQADQFVADSLIPMIGARQKVYERNMQLIDSETRQQAEAISHQIQHLFKYCQGSAHIWDIHEIGLAQTERHLQERLQIARRDHDLESQDRENQLDVVMDRMRQEGSEALLAKDLAKVKESLQQIHEMYDKFHKDQIEVVQSYPHMVRAELADFDLAVRSYFAVDREMPPPSETTIAQKQKAGQLYEEERQALQLHQLKRSTTSPTRGLAGLAPRPSATLAAAEHLEDTVDVSRYALKDLATNPLPGVIGQVLRTERGTDFYVLVVASEETEPLQRIKQDITEEGNENMDNLFLTEVQGPSVLRKDSSYLKSFAIELDYFLELKKTIRLNFLSYMERWSEEAIQRAHSVVAAKCEELTSELELRYHLHAPRVRRAELDVHNVRAAELVMHNERVVRHCKGINQSLAELRQKFNALLVEHQSRFEKFQTSVTAIENIITRANKSSMLVEQQAAVQQYKEDFMSDIRTSLRTFRHTLDTSLQMMRESNAFFIKSFKLFSDGGNFCPEEIDLFRKSLDKYSHKIDDAEGVVMSELEGIEAKWLRKANQISQDFEDRFKNHMIDLVFIEKVARWLTNTQVKIKAEVADSNSQAKRLAQHLNDLERRIDACDKPNLDKEVVTPLSLKQGLKPLFEAFHARSHYIKCGLDNGKTNQLEAVDQISSKSARVGFESDPSGVPPSFGGGQPTKLGRQPTEDPTISLVKNIYRTQKPHMAAEPETVPAKKAEQPSDETPPAGEKEARPITDKSNKSSKQSRQKARQGSSVMDPTKNRHSSAARRVTRFDRRERRFQVFPDEPPVEPDYFEQNWADFLGKVKRILREAHEGLLSAAEIFYKQKGTHQITRSYALQPTMEQCADTITQKLQSYYVQADEYHNECIQEFRQQLIRLENLMERIPSLVIREIVELSQSALELEKKSLETIFTQRMQQIDTKRFEHKTLLRPTLGHPNQTEKMAALCHDESSRNTLCVNEIVDQETALKQLMECHAAEFVWKLSAANAELLVLFDDILTCDDVTKGRVAPNKYPTNELIRRNKQGEPLADEIPDTIMPRGSAIWEGLPTNELIAIRPSPQQIKESKKSLAKPKAISTAKIHTQKTTVGHNSSVAARNKAYNAYKQMFFDSVTVAEKERDERLLAEKRWTESWMASIEKIKSLY